MRSQIKTHQFGKASQILLSQNDTPKPIQIPCRYHPGSSCLNYCHEFKCFRLLCEQCIEQHLEHHKKTSIRVDSIKSLKKVREYCIDKLNRLLQQLCINMNDLKSPKKPQQIIQDVNFKFEKVKAVMFEIIESQLNRFQEQIRNKVNQSFSTIQNLRDIHANLEKIINQLNESKLIIIEGNREMADAMEKVLSMDDQVYKQSFSKQVQIYSQKLAMTEFDIGINQGAFRNSVNQCLKITKSQYKPQFEQISRSKVKGQHTQQLKISQMNNSMNIEEIMIPKIQSSFSFLYFFQNQSPYLHLLDFSAATSPKHELKKLVTNQGPYQVPQFHASLLSESGYIFISGGIIIDEDNEDEPEKKSNLMGRYSLKEGRFKSDFSFITPRSSHSMVEADGYIYILGGYGEAQTPIQYTVQEVNIRSGDVKQLQKSTYGGSNISSIFYPYIIKASQEGVEAYSLVANVWSTLKIHGSHFNFYRECGFTKLSDDVLFVYGGYNMKDQEGVDKCYAWQIDNLHANNLKALSINVKDLKNVRLPSKGGFWNNPGIILGGTLYVLQNIQNAETGHVIESKRDILEYHDESWSIINY